MTNIDYKKSCTEILVIINNMSIENFNKIPKELINAFEENRDLNYSFELDYSKDLKNQNISEFTKAILTVLYKDYWASEDKKKQLEQREKIESDRLEQLKREMYNPDDIFKRKDTAQIKKTDVVENDLLPVVKENWYIKAKKFINKILRRDF